MYNAHKHYQREYKLVQFLVNSPQGVQQVKFLVNSPQGVQQVKVSHIFEHAVLVRFFGLNSFFYNTCIVKECNTNFVKSF